MGEMRVDRFAGYAWGVLGFNLLVILWGAYVRATGSGAGCGSHWPLCNGEVMLRSAEIETLIEFTHRATSGLALLLVVAMFIWARRVRPAGHVVRTGALLSLVFIVVEALLGAGLVLFELVADDDSVFRAVSMVLHLTNTFILVAVLSLTAWWASGGGRPRISRGDGRVWLLAIGLVSLLVVGATGAIAALGDTLFPSASLGEGLRDSFSSESHPLIQLRKYHPFFAIGAGLYVVGLARYLARSGDGVTGRLASALSGVYLLQLGIGVTNIALLAPVSVQLIHLLLADVVWIGLVLLGASTLAADSPGGPATLEPTRRPTAANASRT